MLLRELACVPGWRSLDRVCPQIEWREEDGHVYMTGPAELVFSGSFSLA